jgi:hypothetical protein
VGRNGPNNVCTYEEMNENKEKSLEFSTISHSEKQLFD